ncbi:Ohr family peroxiredoxin [Lentzea tibetensis]|uniref:Ohr family peroxiredoxin n=1 Tax=Lentzea tibetensis TaxID=2591470 RepID=A0A563EQ78_9PSEU|nr:Ohr family peroxiredoxin [Lentzea tibetensis]TWP49530.1 Ohr family peroxiredoxin [Lentzea tibetensis]
MTTELNKVLYTAKANAVGGRSGTVVTDDGRLDVQLAPPRKKTPGATNPEQLFAAGFAACFTSALAEVAAEHGVDASQAEVSCEVDLGTTSTPGGYGLGVRIEVAVPGVPAEKLQDLLHAADATCPYSEAVRGNIPVVLKAR